MFLAEQLQILGPDPPRWWHTGTDPDFRANITPPQWRALLFLSFEFFCFGHGTPLQVGVPPPCTRFSPGSDPTNVESSRARNSVPKPCVKHRQASRDGASWALEPLVPGKLKEFPILHRKRTSFACIFNCSFH